MRDLYELCPKFESCSAPKCPLDSQYHTRAPRLPGEEKCTARKRTRLAIVKAHPEYRLSYQGYTSGEFKGLRLIPYSAGPVESQIEVS